MKISTLFRVAVLLTALLGISFIAAAYDFVVDGICYNISGSNASVTYVTTNYNSYSGNVVIPSTVTNKGTTYSVTSIGSCAFYGCSGLMSVTIPNSVTSIGQKAFSFSTALTSVTIPESVISIGDMAFRGCTALKTLNYNAISCADFYNGSVYYFSSGNLPFYNLNITTINLGANVQKIPAYFAYGLTQLSSLTIPNKVTSIGCYAFTDCSGLTQLIWNAKNCTTSTYIPTSNISQVKIGSTVEVLPPYFVSGSKITSVIFPRTLTSISNSAFAGCSELKSVSIPTSVTTIENSAFQRCTSMTNVTIPNSVTTIGYEAFYGCSGLTSVTIGNSVQVINGGTFYGCDNLTDLTIGNSVHTIYSGAFAGCRKLKYISCTSIMPPEYDDGDYYERLFDDITYQNAILYVPDLTYSYYKRCDPWNNFMEIKTEPYCYGGVAFDSHVYPTSVRMDAGDESEECYFTFGNKQYQLLLVTGLEPNNIYSTVYTRNWGDDVPLKFYTPELRMVPEGGKMLTETAAQLMAETNMADEETMCGFDWRRLEGPDDYLGTRVYCPVYDGKMAGTLKNLSKDTWYKFRPFYKSSAGNVYYGDWVTFFSGDWGVEFDPVVYTYNSPAVSETDATLQGVALRGSSEITEQGFEYWKKGTSNVKKVTASGERMSAVVSGLEAETSYKFRAFVTADGKTLRGSDVEFVTRKGEHHVDNSLDVNADGVVNIADMNVVINVILSGNNDNKCDVNGDGVVNISDINAIISAILGN